MKVFFIIIIAIVNLSCSTKEKSAEIISYSGNQIDSIRRENLKANVDSTIILGFRFGMSKQQYDYNYERLIRNKTLHKFSKTDYSYWITDDSLSGNINGILIPIFDNDQLITLKMLARGTTAATPEGSLILKSYLNKNFGTSYTSIRSVSDIRVKGGVEVEVKREPVQTDPNMKPLVHDIVTFRPTQLALLSHL